MKGLVVAVVFGVSLTCNSAFACKMSVLGESTTMLRAITKYISITVDQGESVSRIDVTGRTVKVQFVSGDGVCKAKTYVIEISPSCRATVKTMLGTQDQCS